MGCALEGGGGCKEAWDSVNQGAGSKGPFLEKRKTAGEKDSSFSRTKPSSHCSQHSLETMKVRR